MRQPNKARSGFTLIEIMVATCILTMIVLSLSAMLSSTSKTYSMGRQRVNNFTKARGMLEVIARDLRDAVIRPDLLSFPNSSFEFYTMQPGILSSNARQVSLVSYVIDSTSSLSTLQRGDVGIAWNSMPETILFGNKAASQLPVPVMRDTIDGVVGFQAVFCYADGTASISYDSSQTLSAVIVTMAVIDDDSLKVLSGSQIGQIKRSLISAAQSTAEVTSIKLTWDNYLCEPNQFPWGQYPKTLATGFKIYERYVPLSSPIN